MTTDWVYPEEYDKFPNQLYITTVKELQDVILRNVYIYPKFIQNWGREALILSIAFRHWHFIHEVTSKHERICLKDRLTDKYVYLSITRPAPKTFLFKHCIQTSQGIKGTGLKWILNKDSEVLDEIEQLAYPEKWR